ncbi:PGPGW domain-containing protein [Nocardioides sp. CER19]|uniref:PGPGW domain-containing protein n=1 Tax=Nocardioides sp. CER19 TaxID=3038538 RepID=UPI00244A5D8A|nr:PGPGW domain-containing protein [Nocardioides sp. CER19]MDH2413028.1 PGPGW domain-containing protein [Nocardioides sp. CER19]
MKRLVLETLGWLLVVAGVAALVLPGPGLLMIFAGLVLLSQQYEWAERRVEPVRLRALRGAADSVETWPRIALSTLGALAILAFGILWDVDPPAPEWWPLEASYWLLGGVWTGLTLTLSGLLALALLVYSYRRFHGRPEARTELDREIEEADEES